MDGWICPKYDGFQLQCRPSSIFLKKSAIVQQQGSYNMEDGTLQDVWLYPHWSLTGATAATVVAATGATMATVGWKKSWLRRAATTSASAADRAAAVVALVRAEMRGLLRKSTGLVMGLGTLPRARAAKTARRSEPAAAPFRIWTRALLELSSELEPEPDSELELEPDPDELEPEELDPEELDPEELDPEELDPEPCLSTAGCGRSMLARLLWRILELESPWLGRERLEGVRRTQRARAREVVGTLMLRRLQCCRYGLLLY